MSLPGTKPPTLVDAVWQLVYRYIFPLARMWWWPSGSRHEGALVAIHVGEAMLLVLPSYQSAWTFPGGGVRDGETPEAAAWLEDAQSRSMIGCDGIPDWHKVSRDQAMPPLLAAGMATGQAVPESS